MVPEGSGRSITAVGGHLSERWDEGMLQAAVGVLELLLIELVSEPWES
jgi:hypothetical protein